jgi:hypothetical protein
MPVLFSGNGFTGSITFGCREIDSRGTNFWPLNQSEKARALLLRAS